VIRAGKGDPDLVEEKWKELQEYRSHAKKRPWREREVIGGKGGGGEGPGQNVRASLAEEDGNKGSVGKRRPPA